MKESTPNILFTKQKNLCLGCGLCSDVCPTNSISIQPINGEYKPFVDAETCLNPKGCHKCSSICPGLGVNLNEIGQTCFSNEGKSIYHKLIGYYHSSYSGYASNNEVRYHGASGGLLTAFLSYLLDKKFISAAVVAENDLSQPFCNKTVLVHNSGDLYKARSSKYCPVSYNGIIKQIKEEPGKVVVVGLPCVMQGFRKVEKTDKQLREKIFGYFGLYCSCGRTFNLTEYTFKQNNVDRKTLKYFQYRDNGCLGSLVAKDANKEVSIPFELYYHPLRSFFIPNRCQFCIDHYSELSDLSFGDIHHGKYKEDKIGINSLIVRNYAMLEFLNKAAEDGYLCLNKLSQEDLVKCQASAPKKKGRVGGVLKFCRALSIATPSYDVTLTRFNYLKSIAYYIFAKSQMFVGRHRKLWWIVSLLKKKGRVS